MSIASSFTSFATSFQGSFSRLSLSGFQLDQMIDDIRLEEGDIHIPAVSFDEIRVNEIVTDGSFKCYHGYINAYGKGDGKKYYAIKCLTGKHPKRALNWIKEIHIVSTLKHQNIRNIHAISRRNLSDCLESETHELNVANRFFIVTDTIQETVRRRMDMWRLTEKTNSGAGSFLSNFGAGKSNSMTVGKADALDRVKFIGHEVSKAMTYLHSQNVAFGSLSTDKIGFDCDGTVKLTNFKDAVSVQGDKDLMKTRFAQDIYYFGLLLWELFTLKKPIEKRPPLNGVIPSEKVREMIRQCWDSDIEKRPSFRRITKRLLEATSDCRHNVVAANKGEQVGQEYQEEPVPMKSLFLNSPKGNKKKVFRVSKVDLTLHLLRDACEDDLKCGLTVGTNES